MLTNSLPGAPVEWIRRQFHRNDAARAVKSGSRRALRSGCRPAGVERSPQRNGAQPRARRKRPTNVDFVPSSGTSGCGMERIGHGREGDRACQWTNSGMERPLVRRAGCIDPGVSRRVLHSPSFRVLWASQLSQTSCLFFDSAFNPCFRSGVPKSFAKCDQFLRVR